MATREPVSTVRVESILILNLPMNYEETKPSINKIVDFPLINLDPTNYLAPVPSETLIRHKELLLNGSMPRKQGTLRARLSRAPGRDPLDVRY